MTAPECPYCKTNQDNFQDQNIDIASDYSFIDIWFNCNNPDCGKRYMADFRLQKVVTLEEATE